MARMIELHFRRDGTVQIDAIGYKGLDCEKATRAFEEALGRVTRRTLKPEHHVQQKQTQTTGGRR